jgi:RHS repeat-associated protein
MVVLVAPGMNSSNPVEFEITANPLPSLWLDQDIGATGLLGSATYSKGTFTINAAGGGLYGTADAVHFVYLPLPGDGSIIARLVGLQGSTAQAGLMVRETMSSGARVVANLYNRNNDDFFTMYKRTTPGASLSSQNGTYITTQPYWMMLARTGNTFNAYISTDGVNWTQIGTTQTDSMAQSVDVGLVVSSSSATSIATATFDSVSVNSDLLVAPVITGVSNTTGPLGSQITITGSGFGTAQGGSLVVMNGFPQTVNSWSPTSITSSIPSGSTSGPLEVLLSPTMDSSNPVDFEVTSLPLPRGWLDQDVGSIGLSGSASYSSGIFTINGAGLGLSGTADGFHFVYQPLSGDGVIIARLDSLPGTTPQAGLMVRETMSPGARMVANMYYPGGDDFFMMYERTTTGGSISSQSGVYEPTLPYWLKLARTGNTFNGYVSSDGVNWVQIGSTQTVTMAQSVYIGFAVSDVNTATLATATFDNQSFTPGTMPIISSISPVLGALGSSITINGSNFGSTQGTSVLNFNGIAATSITNWSSSQIVAAVPTNATTGPVTVTVNSIESNTNFPFTVIHPVLTSIAPPVGQAGATVVLTGSGFGANQGTSQVLFNGIAGNVVSWSNTSISVGVPTGATSGPLTVVESGVSSNGVSFSVETLNITGISPSSGPAGTVVTISGTGFGATQTSSTVMFYGTATTVQSWSDTQFTAVVPAGAGSGFVEVTVGGVTWYGPQFTMTTTIQTADSFNNLSTYTSSLVGGIWVPLVGQGSGCSTCTQRGNISYTYDANGHALTRTDENGHTTTYTYDSNGDVLTVTAPISSTNSATTTYTYNSFGEVLTATDPLGFVTTNTYDGKGNLLTVTTPAPGNGASASVTQFAYNSLGELTKITDPLNNQTNIAYFSTGLIQTITDAQSNVTTYAYDSKGNRTSVTDANNKQTTFTYDAMNRLTQITYPDSTTTKFTYDIRGRRTSVTDQNSKTTNYAYDNADRLTTVTDAASNVTTYGYDTESNLTSIEDANNNTTSFSYDAFGRVTKTTFPSGYVETYGYDNVGNLTSKTDRKNQLLTYTYDQLNRLTEKSYPDTTTVNYTYDNDSRLTQVVDPTGTYQFTFDNMGRLTATSTQYAFLTSRSFTTSYGYDAASNRTSFTDPESGSSTYVYDTLNRLQTLTPPAAISGGSFGFGYDVLSRRTSLTRPNSVNTSYSYDNLSRLLSVTHAKSGTTLDGATYTVDNAGNRLTRTPQPSGTASTYGYDNIYELLSVVQGSSTTESYTYDPVGNRLTDLGSASWSYNTSNELNSRPSVTYTYDYNGNTLTMVNSSGTTSYAWDFENRLTTATLPGSGGTLTFKYDPFGRRIYKSSSSATSIYAYDGDNLIEETNSAGTAVARYSQGLNIDEPLATLRSGTTSYYQADGLGSLTSLSNSSGALANTYTYDSFGNLVASSGSLVNNFRYTGREFDTETGLYYYRARYYDPNAGRFISEDPIGFRGDGPNFYLYVLGNPANWIDPFGLLVELYCETIPSTRGGGFGNLNGIKNGAALLMSRAHHCYIRVKCNGKDETIELGGPVGNEKYGHPLRSPFNPKRGGIRIPIRPPSGYKCCQFEDNLLNAFKQLSGNLPEYHGYPGPNSNTFAFQIITSAGGDVEFPNTAYGWDYLP